MTLQVNTKPLVLVPNQARAVLPARTPKLNSARATGAELFDDITAHLRRFVVLPSEHAATVIAAWVIHTHLYHNQASTPRLIITASGKNSGKSILCECIRPMCTGEQELEADHGSVAFVRGGVMTADATPAFVIGSIEHANQNGKRVTIIMDESDVEGSSGADMMALRKTVNSGYRPSGSAGRLMGGKLVRRSTYAPFVISGIKGNIHETTLSRAIIVHMRPADAGDTFEYYKPRLHDGLGDALHARIALWADEISTVIGAVEPDMEGVYNRDREVWEPLIQIGYLAGEKVSKALREAMYFWLNGGTKREPRNTGEALLTDILDIFGGLEVDKMFTADLLVFLKGKEDYEDITEWTLAKLLKGHDVNTRMLRIDGRQTRGYRLEDLERAWDGVVNG